LPQGHTDKGKGERLIFLEWIQRGEILATSSGIGSTEKRGTKGKKEGLPQEKKDEWSLRTVIKKGKGPVSEPEKGKGPIASAEIEAEGKGAGKRLGGGGTMVNGG